MFPLNLDKGTVFHSQYETQYYDTAISRRFYMRVWYLPVRENFLATTDKTEVKLLFC